MSTLGAVQIAAVAALKASPALAAYQAHGMSAAGVPVYDGVPQEARYPFVAVETLLGSPEWLFGQRAGDDTLQLGVWDDHAGFARVHEILAIVDDVLSAAGFRLELVQALQDPSGVRHGIYRARRWSV